MIQNSNLSLIVTFRHNKGSQCPRSLFEIVNLFSQCGNVKSVDMINFNQVRVEYFDTRDAVAANGYFSRHPGVESSTWGNAREVTFTLADGSTPWMIWRRLAHMYGDVESMKVIGNTVKATFVSEESVMLLQEWEEQRALERQYMSNPTMGPQRLGNPIMGNPKTGPPNRLEGGRGMPHARCPQDRPTMPLANCPGQGPLQTKKDFGSKLDFGNMNIPQNVKEPVNIRKGFGVPPGLQQKHFAQHPKDIYEAQDAYPAEYGGFPQTLAAYQRLVPGLNPKFTEEDSRQSSNSSTTLASGYGHGVHPLTSEEEDLEIQSAEALNPNEFKIDLDVIARGEDKRTTCMIRNIPNQYTQRSLAATIDQQSPDSVYNFLYVPINFRNRRNVGYAFINFEQPKHIIPFFHNFDGCNWPKFNSEKVCAVAYARLQGLEALISHFSNSGSQQRKPPPKAEPLFRITGNSRQQFAVDRSNVVADILRDQDALADNIEDGTIRLDEIWDDDDEVDGADL